MRWLLTALLITAQAGAQTILYQAPASPNLEYRARLKASPQFLSPTQNFLNHRPSAAARDHLLEAFADAQKAFVNHTTEVARAQFAQVAALLTGEDWGPTEREVFLVVLLRLAQLESGVAAKDAWLRQAALLGPGLSVDASLFPPPLLKRIDEWRTTAARVHPADRFEDADWTRILVNGVECARLNCPTFPQVAGKVRLTFLSDKWLPQTLVVDFTTSIKIRPGKIAWLQGSCDQPDFHPRAANVAFKQGFWGLTCEKPAPALNLRPVGLAEAAPLALPVTTAPSPKRFYHSAWFWVGVGGVALAAFLIAAQSHHEHDQAEPTTTYSY